MIETPPWAAGLAESAAREKLERLAAARFANVGAAASHLARGGVDLRVYRRDTIASLNGVARQPPPGGGGKRGKVRELSYRSRQRMVFGIRNCEADFSAMITLTWRLQDAPHSGREAKEALRTFLQQLTRAGCTWAWFVEFTRAGAPHFHVLVNGITGWDATRRRGRVVSRWQESLLSMAWVDHLEAAARKFGRDIPEDSKHIMRRASVCLERVEAEDGAARYAAKYGAKMEQKEIPPDFQDLGRWWGMSRGIRPQVRDSGNIDDETAAAVLAWGERVDENGIRSRFPYRVQFGSDLPPLPPLRLPAQLAAGGDPPPS